MNILDFFNLDGKTAVVTGASRGLGSAFATALAEAGASIVITCRHGSDLGKTADTVRGLGRDVLEIESDITDEVQVKEMVERTIEKFGTIDILVNNAAAERINKAPDETTLEEWQFVINTNVTGIFLCSRETVKVMKKQKRGKIINLSSISGSIINRYFHGGSYDVSKSAVSALTKAMAVEYAPYNINIIAIAPGYYGTVPNRKWFDSNPQIYKDVLDMVPLGRLGNIRELSGLVVSLASDVSNYMTGTTITIDGGYTIW